MRLQSFNHYCLSELSSEELSTIEGGGKIKIIKKYGKKVWEYIDKGLTWIGVYDFASDVSEGYKEGTKSCNCK
jgi:hypothetical protein